jgi:hypothetical protein
MFVQIVTDCPNIKKYATHLAKLDKKCVAIQLVDLPPC